MMLVHPLNTHLHFKKYTTKLILANKCLRDRNTNLLLHSIVIIIFLPVRVDDVIAECSAPWLTIINTYREEEHARQARITFSSHYKYITPKHLHTFQYIPEIVNMASSSYYRTSWTRTHKMSLAMIYATANGGVPTPVLWEKIFRGRRGKEYGILDAWMLFTQSRHVVHIYLYRLACS